MRHLLLNAEPQSCFPSDRYEAIPDFGSPLAGGLHSLWLPNGLEPRSSANAFHLNGKRDATTGEFAAGYYRRRFQTGAALSGLTIAPGSGGNISTPFGHAFAYSNEQAGLSVGGLGYSPVYSGDGTNKVVSVCVWFRINRVNGSGYPTLIGNSYTTTWWLGVRTSTGAYKAIFRNNSAPYGSFEWGSYGADLRKVTCVAFTFPCDANKTASVFHNGALAVQGTIPNASGVAGNLDVYALSSATPGMFVEIFGFASWTRALYPEEARELASGPSVLLAKRHRFWYAPFMAYSAAEITSGSDLVAVDFRGTPRSAVIAGTARLLAYRRPPAAPERTVSIRSEGRSVSPAAESRSLCVPRENRGVDA
jgi:hypothetical protein